MALNYSVDQPTKDQKRMTITNFYKNDPTFKINKVLEKVEVGKDRINDMKATEMHSMTKYAQKFHIDKSVYKEIFKEQQNKY